MTSASDWATTGNSLQNDASWCKIIPARDWKGYARRGFSLPKELFLPSSSRRVPSRSRSCELMRRHPSALTSVASDHKTTLLVLPRVLPENGYLLTVRENISLPPRAISTGAISTRAISTPARRIESAASVAHFNVENIPSQTTVNVITKLHPYHGSEIVDVCFNSNPTSPSHPSSVSKADKANVNKKAYDIVDANVNVGVDADFPSPQSKLSPLLSKSETFRQKLTQTQSLRNGSLKPRANLPFVSPQVQSRSRLFHSSSQSRLCSKRRGTSKSVSKQRRNKVACLGCRRRKIRCVPSTDDEIKLENTIVGTGIKIVPCKACQHAGIECVLGNKEMHRKARRPIVRPVDVDGHKPRARLADSLNPNKNRQCPRNTRCTRPFLHPGHCRLTKRTFGVEDAERLASKRAKKRRIKAVMSKIEEQHACNQLLMLRSQGRADCFSEVEASL
ncbi:hypothetical protein AAMO2058_000006100 [Amorphochlora amoebiformis]|eukprot:18184-Amorphochlora_amoeboformis.AAC.1